MRDSEAGAKKAHGNLMSVWRDRLVLGALLSAVLPALLSACEGPDDNYAFGDAGAGSGGTAAGLSGGDAGRAGAAGSGGADGRSLQGGATAAGGSGGNAQTGGTEPTLLPDGGSSGGADPSSTAGESTTGGDSGASIGGAGGVPASTSGAGGALPDAGGSGGKQDAQAGDAGEGGSVEPGSCAPAARVRRELLQDGRFEPSASSWKLTNTDLQITGDAHTSPSFVRLAGSSGPDLYTGINQAVVFPPEAADIELSLYIRIESVDGNPDDIFYVGWNEPDSDEVEAFLVPNELIPDWQLISQDVPATMAGRTMLLIIAAQNGAGAGGYWTYWIDTVSVTALVCP
jgi:hypothetical protein